MRRIIKLAPLAALFGLAGCDNNAAECERLFHDKPKQPLALDFCKKAADEGDATAQLRSAELLLQQQQSEQAVEYLVKSANQQHPQALFLMAQRREQAEALDGAAFYYAESCKLNVMRACEWLAGQKATQARLAESKQADEARAAEQREAKHQAELAAAEQARKEAERLKREAEQKRAEEEKSRLEAERQKQEAEQKARLAEEKARQEVQAKQQAEQQAKQAAQTAVNFPKMTQTELRQTFSDFGAEWTKGGVAALETWVRNCYANSTFKKGCFYFDVLSSTTDQLLSFEDKNRKTHHYFEERYVRIRAVQNVPELRTLSETAFDAVFHQTEQDLMDNIHLFEEILNVRQQRLAQKAKNAAGADPSLQKYEQNGLWGFTDQYGNIVIRPQYLAVGGFYEGRAVVQAAHNRMWGYIDKQDNWVVPPQFCMAGRFNEGLAGAYKNGYWLGDQCVGGKWGYLNTAGNWAINPIFDTATIFKNGKAKVSYKGTEGYINKQGNWTK